MAFWDYGLKGSISMAASGGISYPYGTIANLDNAKIVGSFSLDSNADTNETYRILLNTFSLGTQLYLECYPSASEVVSAGTKVAHNVRLAIRSNGNWIYPNQGYYSGGNTSYLTSGKGTFSIYYYLYYMFTHTEQPSFAYPYGSAAAGLTNQIAMRCTSSGVEFYIIGHPAEFTPVDTTYYWDCPCTSIGGISATYLNNTDLFDPNADGLSEEDINSGGGEVGDLPVSPSYPSDDIDFPSLPTGASAFGFSRLNLFKCSDAQLASALDILYSDSTESTLETIVESAKKWWYKPEQYCISLMLSPVNATTSASKNIKFGKYDSGVSAPYVTQQWHIVDCGSISVPLKFGNFIDFEPHARAKIFLPFVGFRSISLNEIMGGTIYIKYYVDILTGVSVCMLKVVKTQSSSSVLYTYDCNTQMQVPLTSNNYNTVISSLLSASVSALSAPATGGASLIAGAVNTASAIASPEMTQSGSLSPNSGMLSILTPFIAIQMPVPSIPSNYNSEVGKPSNVYTLIGNMSGYTQIDEMHLSIPGATSEEVNMIEDLFKTGVFI